MESALTSKGQVTIPKEAREHLGLKPGDRVRFFIQPDGHLVILSTLPVTALRGIARTRKRASLADMDAAVEKGMRDEWKRGNKR